MPRVKRGTTANKKRKHLLKYTKGFRWGRKSKYRLAKDAIFHAWEYAYRDRKVRKRDFRKLWQLKINSQARKLGITYGKLIHGLKQKHIDLDRKVLSEFAEKSPAIFKEIVENVKK